MLGIITLSWSFIIGVFLLGVSLHTGSQIHQQFSAPQKGKCFIWKPLRDLGFHRRRSQMSTTPPCPSGFSTQKGKESLYGTKLPYLLYHLYFDHFICVMCAVFLRWKCTVFLFVIKKFPVWHTLWLCRYPVSHLWQSVSLRCPIFTIGVLTRVLKCRIM